MLKRDVFNKFLKVPLMLWSTCGHRQSVAVGRVQSTDTKMGVSLFRDLGMIWPNVMIFGLPIELSINTASTLTPSTPAVV